jgi:uncharacterized protein
VTRAAPTRPPATGVREAPFNLRAAVESEPNDGRTLDGFGAVFNSLTTIDSFEGRFREQIANKAMDRSFRETPPKIQFDHGRHPMIGSIPIAQLVSIREAVDPVLAPTGGAHVVARIFDNWLMAPVRDAIQGQAIDGMSFRFEVVREAWAYADGKPIVGDRALVDELSRAVYDDVPEDELPVRTLKELKVREIGPVVFPAYADTSVSVRSKVIDLGRLNEPGQRDFLARALFIADAAESQPEVRDADDDPASLMGGLDAILDQASGLVADVDLSSLPPEVAQALSLIAAAETASDALMEAMGIYDPDEADESGRSTRPGRAATHRTVGEHPPKDDAQRVAAPVADEHPSKNDAQQSTSAVGERPSKPLGRRDVDVLLRRSRDNLLTIKREGKKL